MLTRSRVTATPSLIKPTYSSPVPDAGPKCYNYRITGHMSRECPKPRRTPAVNEIDDREAQELAEATSYANQEDVETDPDSGNKHV